jgi:hypothetical protein
MDSSIQRRSDHAEFQHTTPEQRKCCSAPPARPLGPRPTPAETVQAASQKAHVLLDGTLQPIDRIAADRPFYPGSASTE